MIVKFCDSLARRNSEALSFIPRPKLEHYAAAGQILTAQENGDPCGFLIYGNGYPTLRVYQACIQYDARRQDHGLALVQRLVKIATAKGAEGISLKCADDLEANRFWAAAGFRLVGKLPGGQRRRRTLNVYYLPLWPTLPL